MQDTLASTAVASDAPPGKPAWSPMAIACFSIVFSILPAGIMAAINLGRLGRPDLRLVRLSHYILVFVILSGFRLALNAQGANAFLLFLLVNIAYARHFYESQRKLYAVHRARGGKRASLLLPAALCIAFLIAAFGIGLMWGPAE